MRVSAVIPTYNRKTYVFRAIDSVLGQTVPPDEIIVVDDGSTDGTYEVIRSRYGSRITVLSQENKGVSAARMRAIEEAQGEWVAFLDSDDIWLPTKLERQFNALTQFGNEVGACFTDGNKTTDPNFSAFNWAGLESQSRFGLLEEPAKYVLARRTPIGIQTLLVRRSILEELGGFDQRLFVAEDTDLLFRLSLKTRFCFVSEQLVQFDCARLRPRLSDYFNRMDDQTYACLLYMHRKWLALPELADPAYRSKIEDSRRFLLYGWMAKDLHSLKPANAFQKVEVLRTLGDSHLTIVSTLVSRAARRVLRSLR